jgi:putative membrane protein
MIRLIVRTVVLLAANAVGLIVANIVLSGFHLNFSGFIIAVAIFTVASALMLPFIASMLRRRGSSALGGVALIATLVSLIITDIVSDGLSIHGVGTWLAAAVIVWAASLVAAFILPFLGLKKYLAEH